MEESSIPRKHLSELSEEIENSMRTRDLIAMILLKGYFELGAGQSESEIRKSITEVLEQRFPFVRPDHFDFVKRELADRAELAIRSRVLINNEVLLPDR